MISINQRYGERWAQLLNVQKNCVPRQRIESIGSINEENSLRFRFIEQPTPGQHEWQLRNLKLVLHTVWMPQLVICQTSGPRNCLAHDSSNISLRPIPYRMHPSAKKNQKAMCHCYI